MKILFVLFIGFDKHATSEHLLTAVIEQLCKAGHSVHILQKHAGGNLPSIPDALKDLPVTTEIVPSKEADKRDFKSRYFVELKYIRECKKHIHEQYDAVFVQSNFTAGFAVKEIRKKLPQAVITCNVQDIFPYNAAFSGRLNRNGILFKYLAFTQRIGYKKCNNIITISEDMKDTLVADGTPSDKVHVIYNWSYQDDLYENLDTSRVSHIIKDGYFNVVYAGNIGTMQNVDILIEAAKHMENDKSVLFHIIGDGIYKEKLVEKVKEYNLFNVSFWPMQTPDLAPVIYSSASINFIPLVKDVYRTALPSKTATCLACQKPIIFAIGKDSVFGKMVFEETCCPVVDPDDIDEVVKAIKSIKLGECCPKTNKLFLEHFKRSENSKMYAEIITSR